MIDNKVKLYKGKIAKFSYVGTKELCLLLNVYELDPISNKQVFFRDHLWVEVRGIDKKQQGKNIYFYAKEYVYSNSINKEHSGLTIKYPQHIKYKGR